MKYQLLINRLKSTPKALRVLKERGLSFSLDIYSEYSQYWGNQQRPGFYSDQVPTRSGLTYN